MIAAVHVAPVFSVPPALLLAAGMIYYWIRLGRGGVPAARRRVRRWSLVVGLLAVPSLVRGLSFLDPGLEQMDYIVTWSVALLLVLLVFIIALVDAAVTLRAQTHRTERELTDAGRNLARALEERRGESADFTAEDGAGSDR